MKQPQTALPEDDAVAFGFEDIPESEKAARVRGLFRDVAGNYDLMNDLMSGGIHRLWKAAMIDWLRPRRGQRFLDVAGGTGDIALRILDRLDRDPSTRILACDLTDDMLAVGRDRAADQGILSGIDWLCADAESLPLPDRSVDVYSVAFGLRNVTHLDRALAEARRVLAPGGRFLCLEFSHVVVPLLSELYDRYSFSVLPTLGGLVARNRDAYRYLAESIRRFPDQEAFAGMIETAGMAQVRYRNLTGGIAALHSAWRL